MDKSNRRWRHLAILCLSILVCQTGYSTASAQSSDFGMLYELGAEKKLSRKWNLGVETELRTRNNTRTLDRWSMGISAGYKIIKGLKASAGYTFLYDNNEEELSLKSDNVRANKWKPSYWGTRHRFNVSLGGNIDWGRLNISLRERWQYTYRPEMADKKYDIDEMTWSATKSKHKHLLRSRLQLSYDFPHWKFDPFANVELFNGWAIEKMRCNVGIDYKYHKQHVFSLYYRFQKVYEKGDENDHNTHFVGLSYKFKF